MPSVRTDNNTIPKIVADDLLGMVLGRKLGEGASRCVYEFDPNQSCVIKLEITASFQNVHEYQVWQLVRNTRWACWFAPVMMISPSGSVLLMRQTKPCLPVDKLPKRIPSFLADLKFENFGWIDNRLVAHDYGLGNFMEQGLAHAKMVKADWL